MKFDAIVVAGALLIMAATIDFCVFGDGSVAWPSSPKLCAEKGGKLNPYSPKK